MITTLVKKIFGSRNERVVKRLRRIVATINGFEASFQQLSDQELQAKTPYFKEKLSQGYTLDDILPEAFATVREASRRLLGMRHFDVQLIGGMVLHDGNIAEMGTGEGKTLVATLPAYLNALTGRGVHVITVNDYLAKRDADWMRPLYEFLGLTVGVNLSQMAKADKQLAYQADILYGTNNEFGFDYLRDNMAFSLQDKVQPELYFAIVDEVDSILIDEARTPLIISGIAEESSELYMRLNALIPHLQRQESDEQPGDYTLDEKTRQAFLTEAGHDRVEQLMIQENLLAAGENLYAPSHSMLVHHLMACLRAHTLFQKDVDYIVQNDQIIIIDEHTGRMMIGRRWSDGLHQAMEAKEGVTIQNENQTLATITFQNYFRIYEKLSGMTGTADTEAYEFQQIYDLEVVVIPTNRPILRKDLPDQIFLTAQEKYQAIIADIKQAIAQQQPVLVGTASIESSEYLSMLLNQENIEHQVLNAKYHEKEAKIIAEAGRPGTVTLATNMAGRGTDIILGGNVKAEIEALENPSEQDIAQLYEDWQHRHSIVIQAGGLHVIGSERHEARRIDNQLRGRSGRQGDPGSTRFYLSLEDNLLRIFASERLSGMMQRLGMQENEALEHPWLNRVIENAQRRVEGHNFDIRKQLLEYDNVANEQRKVIYEQRNELLAAEEISDYIRDIRQDVISSIISFYVPLESLEEQWDIAGLEKRLEDDFAIAIPVRQWLDADETLHAESLHEKILQTLESEYQQRVAQVEPGVLQQIEKSIMLQILDSFWKDHLASMDYLRQGIHLRGYAQKNPKQEYKREAFILFSQLLDQVREQVCLTLFRLHVQSSQDAELLEQQRRQAAEMPMHFDHPALLADTDDENFAYADHDESASHGPYIREGQKVGRNDPCPCGSGKKFKMCHGQVH